MKLEMRVHGSVLNAVVVLLTYGAHGGVESTVFEELCAMWFDPVSTEGFLSEGRRVLVGAGGRGCCPSVSGVAHDEDAQVCESLGVLPKMCISCRVFHVQTISSTVVTKDPRDESNVFML
jgi:hypothetical protein